MNTGKSTRAAGFSLVEIMVGMTIGLITVLVVAQVMQIAETRKRASTSGSDAIVNASLGLYTIERDAKNAGFGMSSVPGSIGCETRATYGTQPAVTPFPLVPIMISDGANGAPDTLRVLTSSKNGITLPTRVAGDHAQGAGVFFVDSDIGIKVGDMMIAVPAMLNTSSPPITWCTLFRVAGTGGGTNQVPHDSGSQWNHTGAANTLPVGGYIVGDYLVNLGTFVDRTYSIDNNYLSLTEPVWINNTAGALQNLYPNVVQLQAVYGKDTTFPSDGIVDTWNATAPTTAAEWQQVRAVRIALVARSQNREAGTVTLDGAVAASTCNSATPHPAAVCWRPDPAANGVKIDVSAGAPDWQRYRYRVVETTIALRNAIWQQ